MFRPNATLSQLIFRGSLLSCSASAIWLAATLLTGRAQAEAPSANGAAAQPTTETVLQLGNPALPTKIALLLRDGHAVLRAGKVEQVLPLTALAPLHAESLALGAGRVGVIRVAQAEQGGVTALVVRRAGGVSIAWVGDLRWRGDLGERVADALELRDRQGDGVAEIVVGTYDERDRLCGQARTLLQARTLDPHDWQLKPALVGPLASSATAAQPLAAEANSPGPTTLPLLRALRASGGSDGAPGMPTSLLTDGKLDTAWTAAPEHGRRAHFVTLRWEAVSQPIRALAIVPVPNSAGPSGPTMQLEKLTLIDEHGARWSVALSTPPSPGQRLWLTPQQPLHTSCLSLVLEGAQPAAGKAAAALGLAEVEAYTDLDFAGGVQRVVAALAQDAAGAGDAADLLGQLDVDVTSALAEAWPRLSAQGKRRVVRVLATQAKRHGRGLELLGKAVQDADADVSHAALDAALLALPGSDSLLAGFTARPGALSDRVLAALATKTPARAVALGLRTLASPGGAERPAVREAIAAAVQHGGAAAEQECAAWLETQPVPPVPARAAATLALASSPATLALAERVLRASLHDARDFADQWRLVAAAAHLPSEPEADAWLSQLAAGADAWMLRAAAVQALAARHSTATSAVATKALADAYPRVRAAALAALAASPGALEVLAKYARNDKWFLVRSAALDELPQSPAAEPILREALADRTAVVRAAAIRGLRRERVLGAWPAIAGHVSDAQEYPEVIAEGIGFARAFCVADASPALQAVATRGLRPDAWGPDQELGLRALEALGSLGGQAGSWAADQARNPVVPPALRTSLERLSRAPVACTPTPQ